MPRKMQEVVLVGQKGSKLPVTSGLLVEDTSDSVVVQATEKTGRGRGTKTVVRTYTIQKSAVAYYYAETVADGEVADAPAADAAPKKRGRPAKAKVEGDATPKKRGRPPKAKAAAEEATESPKGGSKSGSLFDDTF